tara:strand:- start:336 stop:890 length:555 start_codon:yes stop_codon:yes gene_type:complete
MITLFNGNDPQVQDLNNVHRSGFVYLHGPLEDLNSKLIEDNNWEWDAPDLFVQDEKFKLIGKYLIQESDSKHLDDVQSMPKLIVNEVDCTIFTKTHIDFYAIPCMFYGEKVIAFIKETITQTIYSDSGLLDPTEREIGGKSSHISGRVVLPYDDSLPTFTDSGDLIQDDKRDAWRHAVNHLDWM